MVNGVLAAVLATDERVIGDCQDVPATSEALESFDENGHGSLLSAPSEGKVCAKLVDKHYRSCTAGVSLGILMIEPSACTASAPNVPNLEALPKI